MAGTNNAWNNQIAASYNAITLNAGSNNINIGTDVADNGINIGTVNSVGGRVITMGTYLATMNLNAINLQIATTAPSTAQVQIGSQNGASPVDISCGTSGITIGTNAANAHPVTIGSTNSTSTVTIQCGTGGVNVGANSTVHAVTIGSTLGASSVAINCGTSGVTLGTSANAHSVTIGSTTTTSSVAINCGTGGVTLGTSANAHTTTVGSTTTTSTTTIDCGTGGANFGTSANAHATAVGSTNTTSTTTINSGSGGIIAIGVTGVTVTGAAVLIDATTSQLGTIVSSERYKENIENLDDNNFIELRPVSFQYKANKDGSIHYGMIAEEVAAIMPDLVIYNKEGLPETIAYHEMPALLLHEIQKLRNRIEILERNK